MRKIEYCIEYLGRKDNKFVTYIEAYSEKQASLILRKLLGKNLYRILSVYPYRDSYEEDGEQLKMRGIDEV